MSTFHRCLLLLALAAGGTAAAQSRPVSAAVRPVEITLRAVPEQMAYDLPEFRVFLGEPVRLTFRNEDYMPHNVVICLPREFCTPGAGEEDFGLEVAKAAWELGEDAVRLQWVPKHPRVLVATRMLDGKSTQVLDFQVPDRVGLYPFVCTFPGHAMMMKGMMRVQARAAGLADLRYRAFRGPFTAFPDFAAFGDPAEEGIIADGLLDAGIVKLPGSYALEFDGRLNVPVEGDYTFSIAGNKGPVLLIDGQVRIDHRAGTWWGSSATKTFRLTGGSHRVTLRYWHVTGKYDPEVTLLWGEPKNGLQPLSRVDLLERQRQREYDLNVGMPLKPEKGEPAFYRNFVSEVMPSGFAVGYAEGLNLSWDPVKANVGDLWVGAFIDAKRHRVGRGAGAIKPIGFDVLKPAPGLPLAVLGDPDAAWPAVATSESLGYHFLGYRFDGQRRPTFRYRLGNVTVSDTFHATAAAADRGAGFIRRIHLQSGTGGVPAGMMFRVLASGKWKPEGNGFLTEQGIRIAAVAPVVTRAAGAGQEVLLPVVFQDNAATLTLTYSWPVHKH